MAPVSSLFLMFLISLFNPYGAVSISIAISSLLSPLPYILSPRPWIFDCPCQVEYLQYALPPRTRGGKSPPAGNRRLFCLSRRLFYPTIFDVLTNEL